MEGPSWRLIERTAWLTALGVALFVYLNHRLDRGSIGSVVQVSVPARSIAHQGGVLLVDGADPATVFMSYNCRYCLELLDELAERALSGDIVRGVRLRQTMALQGDLHERWSAIGTLCASRQGEALQYYVRWRESDRLFRAGDALSIATEVGLDQREFRACLNDERNIAVLSEDANAARLLVVNGTPTTFVGPDRAAGASASLTLISGLE